MVPSCCTHTQLSPPLTMADKGYRTTGALKAATLSSYISFLHLIVAVCSTGSLWLCRSLSPALQSPAQRHLHEPVLPNLPALFSSHIKPALGQRQDRDAPVPASPGAAGLLAQPCRFLCSPSSHRADLVQSLT